MTAEQIKKLMSQYCDEYKRSDGFEHRYEENSSDICYALLRHFKPKSVVEFGMSRGGATSFIQAALLKNGGDFKFVAGEKEEDLLKEAMFNVLKKNRVTPNFIGDIQDGIEFVPKELDFAFIDTNHDLELTKWYMENIIKRLKVGGILMLHDWDIKEENGKYVSKGGEPTFEETRYIFELFKEGRWPFEKLFWSNELFPGTESTWWVYKGEK